MGKKELKILLAICSIIIVVIIISILIIKNKEIADVYKTVENDVPQGEKPAYTVQKVDNPTMFFTVQSCIKNYISNDTYHAVKMNVLGGDRIEQYSAFGYIIRDGQKGYFYCKVKLDTINSTYEVTVYNGENINSIDDIILNEDNVVIAENRNNKFEYERLNDEDATRKYFKDYQQNALYFPEDAYELLDEDYKNLRFGSLDNYKKYLTEMQDKIKYGVLTQYSVERNNSYVEYTCVDSYNNYYIIKENAIMDYTIKLDNYTIETEYYKNTYERATNEQKVAGNASKFIKMINTKDYIHAYNLLDETFKNNNFKSLDDFQNYVNDKFYYNCVEKENSITKEGDIYIYELVISDGATRNAQMKKVKIIMKLGEGTDFVMSFSME